MGTCHKYNEYDIKPIPTIYFQDKNLPIKVSPVPNKIIKQVPSTGIAVKKLGCEYLSKIKNEYIKRKTPRTDNKFFSNNSKFFFF